MKCNIGGWELALRYAVGAAALGLLLIPRIRPEWKVTASIVAGSELVIAATRYCPLNDLLGRSTCHRHPVRRGKADRERFGEELFPATAI